jgi:hypothetical protein
VLINAKLNANTFTYFNIFILKNNWRLKFIVYLITSTLVYILDQIHYLFNELITNYQILLKHYDIRIIFYIKRLIDGFVSLTQLGN